jgi:3-oxoacyl-[acyl-carrier protein] reductase
MFASLKDRSVIVTGASKGIGRGIALRFGQVGCNVLVVARDASRGAEGRAEIVAAGGSASAFGADVTRPADMQAMAMAAIEAYGGDRYLVRQRGHLSRGQARIA